MNSNTTASASMLVLGLVTVAGCGKDLDVGSVPIDAPVQTEGLGSSDDDDDDDDGGSSEGPGMTTADATTGDPSPTVSPPCEFAAAGAGLDPTQWGVVCGGSGLESVQSIAIAADGSIYTLTQVLDSGHTVLFGDEEIDTSGYTAGSPGLVLTKLTPEGALEWSHAWSGFAQSIAACDDQVFITVSPPGSGKGTIDVGTGPLQGNLVVAGFASDGIAQWAFGVGQDDDASSGFPIGAARCRDGAGLVVAGEATGGFELGGQLIEAAPTFDPVTFVVALDGAGAGQWATQGDPGRVSATPTSDAGAVVAAFTGEELSLVRYDGVGAVLWQQSLPTGGFVFVSGLEVADDGAVLLSAAFEGQVDLGAGPLINANPAVPNPNDPNEPLFPINDGFVARFDATGTYEWAVHFDGVGSDWPTLVTLDDAGASIVTLTVDEEFSLIRVDDGNVTNADELPAPWPDGIAGHPDGGLALAYHDPAVLPPFEAPLTTRGPADYTIVRVVP